LRIKEQETRLTLQEHDDDEEDIEVRWMKIVFCIVLRLVYEFITELIRLYLPRCLLQQDPMSLRVPYASRSLPGERVSHRSIIPFVATKTA